MTLADIENWVFMSFVFQFVIDQGQQKNAFPNVSQWFHRMSQQSAILNHFGHVKMAEKVLKPVDGSKLEKVDFVKPEVGIEAATWGKKAEKKAVAADDDDFDPFADDEEDEEAEKAK